MKRKYIDELGIKYKDTPQGWCSVKDDPRAEKWKKERQKYGFDERETWALDYSMDLWLYERLKMYDEINIVNTDFYRFEYKNETLTFQDCIDRMIEGLKLDLTLDSWDSKRKDSKIDRKIEDVYPILALCKWCLWW